MVNVHFTSSPIVFGMIVCDCCKGLLHRDDFKPQLFQDDHVAAVRAKYGRNVCTGCIDESGKEAMQ